MGKILKFISIHIPKCGGTAFRRRIIGKIFPGKVVMDYSAYPFEDYYHVRGKSCDIIHGHFRATKYLSYGRPIVTWIRNPVDRIVSHYLYSKMKVDWKVGGGVVKELTFEQYIKEYPNMMSKYLNIPLEQFAFVGVLECWEESMEEFFNVIGERLPLYFFKSSQYVVTKEERKLIEEENEEDFVLWEKVKKRYESAGG